jgi:hypothetical protein
LRDRVSSSCFVRQISTPAWTTCWALNPTAGYRVVVSIPTARKIREIEKRVFISSLNTGTCIGEDIRRLEMHKLVPLVSCKFGVLLQHSYDRILLIVTLD